MDGYDGDAISDQEWGSADEERLDVMFGDDEDIRSDKDLADDYKAGMERQDRMIADYQKDNTALLAERNRMLCDMPTAHKRKCRDCGNVAWHADSVVPYVNCRKCKSQDTRKVSP